MRKPDPERIYLARRGAVLSILTGSGASEERAETLVTAWEAEATAQGLPRHDARFWEGAFEWIGPRRIVPSSRALLATRSANRN